MTVSTRPPYVPGLPEGAEFKPVPLARGKAAPQPRPLWNVPSGVYTVPDHADGLLRVELLKTRRGGYDAWFIRGDGSRDGRVPARQIAELAGRVWRYHFADEES